MGVGVLQINILGMDDGSPEPKSLKFLSLRADTQETGLQRNITEIQIIPTLKECKICLDSNNPQNIIQPCKCTGSMRYVHNNCLSAWIKRTNKTKESYIECQLCKHLILFDLENRSECLQGEEVCKRIKKYPKMFGFVNLVTGVGVALLIYLLVLAFDGSQFDVAKLVVLVMGVVALFVLVVILSCMQAKQFYLKVVQEVVNIYPYREKKRDNSQSRARIFPQISIVDLQ